MSVDQARLTNQLMLLINAFLHLFDKCKKKAQVYHPIGRIVSEAVRE